MTLNLTDDEYCSLLKVVFLGNWMANAYREEPLAEFDNIEQLIMSRASAFKADELVEFDQKKKTWGLKRAFEDDMHEQVNEYNIEALYDELGYWLARRDLVNDIGERKADDMTPAELSTAASSYLEKYDEEFEENGIERIGIIETLPVRGNL